jgi:hypothetical protein
MATEYAGEAMMELKQVEAFYDFRTQTMTTSRMKQENWKRHYLGSAGLIV